MTTMTHEPEETSVAGLWAKDRLLVIERSEINAIARRPAAQSTKLVTAVRRTMETQT